MTTTRLRPVPPVVATKRRPPTRRVRDVAQLGPRARAVRSAVARWSLSVGRCCDYDALTLVLACADEAGDPTTFTEEGVWRMWWIDLGEWCADRCVPVPAGLASTMRVLFDHLDATDGFGAGSDPLEDLVEGMAGAGALWRNGHAPVGAG
ncbi:MAG: hypothetical protein ACE367_01960 [Acidimicrobiales bacterium]